MKFHGIVLPLLAHCWTEGSSRYRYYTPTGLPHPLDASDRRPTRLQGLDSNLLIPKMIRA